MSLLSRLLRQADSVSVLWLPRPEPHPAGTFIGLAGVAGGRVSARWSFPGHEVLAAVSFISVFVGMFLHWRLQRTGRGWRIDFEARRIEPVGLTGDALAIDGSGWSVQVAPGDRRAHVAIDLRHPDLGRAARLLDMPVRGRAETRRLDALAASIARRLRIERSGPTL